MQENFKKAVTILTACLPAIIYIIWLNAYYWLLEGGRYQAFVQPRLWPLLILAMLLLLAYTAAFISHFSVKLKIPSESDAWLKAAILILPVLFLWTIYGQSLGSDAFAKRELSTGQPVSMKDAYARDLPLRAFSGNAPTLLDLILDAEKFDGKRVAVEGMVYRATKADKDSFKLFRFAVACCAADALPFSIQVKTATQKDLQNDTWVRVEGVFSTETTHGKQEPGIEAAIVQPLPTPPPEKRYMFF
jgi:putative membrane protein